MKLYETRPAEVFEDMHFLGNGRLGLTVPGNPVIETIHINEDTLWSGKEEFQENQEHFTALEEARNETLLGNLKKANTIVEEEMSGKWSEGYLPMASLHIIFGQGTRKRTMSLKRVLEYREDEISEYSRTLDLQTAAEKVCWKRDHITYETESFVSGIEDKGYIFCSASDRRNPEIKVLNLSLGLESLLPYEEKVSADCIILTGRAPDHIEPEYTPIAPAFTYSTEKESTSLRFGCSVRVYDTDGQLSCDRDRIYLSDAGFVILEIDGITNYSGFQKKRNPDCGYLIERLHNRRGEKKTYHALKREHIQNYQKLYQRVSVSLPEEYSDSAERETSKRLSDFSDRENDPSLAALLLQYGRYLMISASRPGTQAMNLQGIWSDRLRPAWACNYTTNINVEMNYWSAEVLGLSECHEPLMTLIKELYQSGQKTAKEYYHLPGWVVHHNTDLWRNTEPSCENARWSWWPLGAAWLCDHIRMRYEFTGDVRIWQDMMPAMEGAVIFYLGFLVENEKGELVTAPSVSPENSIYYQGEKELAVTEGCTADLMLIRRLFETYLMACSCLKLECEVSEQVRAALKRFPDYQIGRFGQLQEWKEDYTEYEPGNPHSSHLFGIYPADIITEKKTPLLYEGARNTLYRRILHSKQQSNWSAAWKIGQAARLKEPFIANLMIKNLCSSLGAGMLTRGGCQIDAILGACAGIAEMLLQSHNDCIELLPCIPPDWNSGSFSGFRARGGFEVSADWKAGKITCGTVESKNGGKCHIVAKGLTGVETNHGMINAEEGEALFDMIPGEYCRLVFSNSQEL